MKEDAIIFIPGLSQEFTDQSFVNIARRIALAFDRKAKTAKPTFTVEIANESLTLPNSEKIKYETATILREENSQATPVIDFYKMDYYSSLTQDYQSSNLLNNTLRLLLAIVANLPRFFSLFSKNKAKTVTEIIQVLYAIFILGLLILYMIVLLSASLELISNVLPQDIDIPFLDKFNVSTWLETSTIIVVLVAIVELFQPNIKDLWQKSAITYVSVVDYLSLSLHKNTIEGHLTDLIEHIAEQGKYNNIHLIAYSFGTIIAIDTIFPSGHNPPPERFTKLNTLVTIGCPFDMIRLLWSNYFEKRQGRENTPQRWLNIYSPVDVLGSNFRNDNQDNEAEQTIIFQDSEQKTQFQTKPQNIIYSQGVNPKNLSLFQWLTLIGIRNHAMYWEKTFKKEKNCFDDLISIMYKDHDFLQ